jgi:hypothetical protein
MMGVIAYRRSGALKTIDLRLGLRRLEIDLQRLIDGLPGQLQRAKHSRDAVNAAMGIYQSGARQVWQEQWELDVALIASFPELLPCQDFDFGKATHKQLGKVCTTPAVARVEVQTNIKRVRRQICDDFRGCFAV